jgi:dephospho-CoA kinase
MIIIGLTGSIAMGKTTAANILRDMGYAVHCSDEAVHELLGAGGAAVGDVAEMFPESYDKKTQSIDRARLGDIIFDNDEMREVLEDILHPMVRESQQDFIREQSRLGRKKIILDIPLLFETGAGNRLDYTICVTAPSFIQKQRAMARGMSEEEFEKRLSRQMPDAEKRARADFTVQTGAGIAGTRKALKKIMKDIK